MNFWTIFPIIVLLVLMFLKIPVAYSMLAATISYLIFCPDTPDVAMMIQKMVTANSSFTFLAIPFFVCAGVVFEYSGITRRLMSLCEMLVGQMRGGMAQVNVLLSALMGGLSGSANADAALQSKMIVPQMEKLGYSRGFSCAVTAASSSITPIIPPGIILILYASVSDVSIAKMFYAGYIPGIILTITMMMLTAWIAKRRKLKPSRETRATAGEFGKAFVNALPALFVPFGLVLGLRLGMFTPTEAGAMCVIYSLLIGIFVYKELKLKDLPHIIKETVTNTAGVMFILGAAQVFNVYLSWERLPNRISELFIENISSPWVFLLIVNILLLVLGMFFDGAAAIVMLGPLLVPAAQALGIDLIHFGIVVAVNLTIGGISPPFGSVMFVSTMMTKTRIEDYTKEMLPYFGQLVFCLFLFTYIPITVTLLPNLLGS